LEASSAAPFLGATDAHVVLQGLELLLSALADPATAVFAIGCVSPTGAFEPLRRAAIRRLSRPPPSYKGTVPESLQSDPHHSWAHPANEMSGRLDLAVLELVEWDGSRITPPLMRADGEVVRALAIGDPSRLVPGKSLLKLVGHGKVRGELGNQPLTWTDGPFSSMKENADGCWVTTTADMFSGHSGSPGLHAVDGLLVCWAVWSTVNHEMGYCRPVDLLVDSLCAAYHDVTGLPLAASLEGLAASLEGCIAPQEICESASTEAVERFAELERRCTRERQLDAEHEARMTHLEFKKYCALAELKREELALQRTRVRRLSNSASGTESPGLTEVLASSASSSTDEIASPTPSTAEGCVAPPSTVRMAVEVSKEGLLESVPVCLELDNCAAKVAQLDRSGYRGLRGLKDLLTVGEADIKKLCSGWLPRDRAIFLQWRRDAIADASAHGGGESQKQLARFGLQRALYRRLETEFEERDMMLESIAIEGIGTRFSLRLSLAEGEQLPASEAAWEAYRAALENEMRQWLPAGCHPCVRSLKPGSIIMECDALLDESDECLAALARLCHGNAFFPGRRVLPFMDGTPSPRVDGGVCVRLGKDVASFASDAVRRLLAESARPTVRAGAASALQRHARGRAARSGGGGGGCGAAKARTSEAAFNMVAPGEKQTPNGRGGAGDDGSGRQRWQIIDAEEISLTVKTIETAARDAVYRAHEDPEFFDLTVPPWDWFAENIKVVDGIQHGRRWLSTNVSGDKVDMHTEVDSSGRQKWELHRVDGDDRYYNIKIRNGVPGSRRYLSACVSAFGTHCDLHDRDDGSGRQRWELIDQGGYYHIKIKEGQGEKKFLSTHESGNPVDLYDRDDGSGRQKWILRDVDH